MISNQIFPRLFRKYRQRSHLRTLQDLGNALSQLGQFYEYSLFSHWQKGDRIPKDRSLLLALIHIFIKKDGITSLVEANDFLASVGLGYLTAEELIDVNSKLQLQNNPRPLELKNHSYNTFYDLEKLALIAYEKIYEGYPRDVYLHLTKLQKVIRRMGFYNKTKFENILSRINWVKMRCLSDITKAKDFAASFAQTLSTLDYAQEKKTSQIGENYWMVMAIKRLEIVTRPKRIPLDKKELQTCWDVGKLAVRHTSPNNSDQRLVEYLELAKTALLFKDEYRFQQMIDRCFYYVNRLPPDKKYLQVMAWDVLARGDLGLRNDPHAAFAHIREADKCKSLKYRAINLFIKNTELQAIDQINDPGYAKMREQVAQEIKLESILLNNPYQKLRFQNKKKYIGL